MGAIDREYVARRILAVACAAVLAPSIAIAQEKGQGSGTSAAKVPFDSIFSARSYAEPRQVAAAGVSAGDQWRVHARAEDAPQGEPWLFGRAPAGFLTGFGTGPDGQPLLNGTVDLAGQARAYAKQRLVAGILSKSGFGRGLSRFIDTGDPVFGSSSTFNPQDARSKMLPYISPKFSASEGRVALSLVWKF